MVGDDQDRSRAAYAGEGIYAFTRLPGLHHHRHGRGLYRQPRRPVLLADIPLGRPATTGEIAETVRWLAADAPASATGAVDRRQWGELCRC